jgi:hypothetical protein
MCHNGGHISRLVQIAREKQVTDIDDNPSPSTNRRLAAILAADIAGYSRLMGEDEAATVRDLKAHQAVVLPLVGRYGGRIIDTAGDGILAEFPSVINATECAVEIQTIMTTRNEEVPESRRMLFRMGINLGDASCACKYGTEHLSGDVETNHVAWSIGRDVLLAPPQRGDRVLFFAGPYAEANGRPWQLERAIRFEEQV